MSTLPESLVRYEDELQEAIRRATRCRRRPVVLRAAVAAALVLALALGVVGLVVPGGGPSAVERAAAALAVERGTILHVDMTGRQVNPDGSVATWEDESWQQQSAPFARRQIETSSEAPRAETALVDGRQQLYDAATNTIYTTPPALPEVGRSFAGPKPPPAKAKRLAQEKARKAAQAEAPPEDPFREEILAVLDSGAEQGRTTVGGREALRIASGDGHATYLVDAQTYDPIRLVTVNGDARTTLEFRVYESLDAARNDALVDLRAQHPGARVDATPEGYAEAQARLFPHG